MAQKRAAGGDGPDRDYGKLEQFLGIFAQDRLSVLKSIGTQPKSNKKMYLLSATANPANPRVLISAGTHGSEPAGVFALRDFLENGARDMFAHLNLDILPCNNPHGFETGQRRNPDGIDINHSFFGGGQSPEAAHLMSWFNRNMRSYSLFLDLHEDSIGDLGREFSRADYPGKFYMYETCEDRSRRIGREIIKAVKGLGLPVSMRRSIYGDMSRGGVIWYPEGRTGRVYRDRITFDDFLEGRFTDHVIVVETPTLWELKTRIRVQRKIIDIVLDSLLKQKG